MPNLGDETRANSLDENASPYRKLIWVSCPHCLEERWVVKRRMSSNTTRLCRSCTIQISSAKFNLTYNRDAN